MPLALANCDTRMEAAIAKMERERAPLAFDFDDTRRSLNEAESAARKLTALHWDNDCVLPLDRLPKCVREVLANNSTEQARQQAQARHIKAWERMTAIEREIVDLRARRNRAGLEITKTYGKTPAENIPPQPPRRHSCL